jgi:hypothetical protein
MTDSISHLTSQLRTAYDKAGLSEVARRRRTVTKFAARHGLIHFSSVGNETSHISIIRGATAALDQKDSNICIGSHDGYDIVFFERQATSSHPSHEPVRHHWLVMSFDLHEHPSLPFVFIGTKQQSKTFYANLFATRREVRHLEPSFYTGSEHIGHHYSIIASPAEQLFLTQLLSTPITETMARYHHSFAIEVQDDTLTVITDASQFSEQTLSKMMHYGLWLARHIDNTIK